MENTIENFTRIIKRLSKSMPSKERSVKKIFGYIVKKPATWGLLGSFLKASWGLSGDYKTNQESIDRS